jgi:hypothetical protein
MQFILPSVPHVQAGFAPTAVQRYTKEVKSKEVKIKKLLPLYIY